MLYLTLLRNQWKQLTRSYASRYRWLAILVLVLIGLYVASLLILGGLFFQEMLQAAVPGRAPLAFLNEHLLSVFLGLLLLRFFLQRTPQLRIQPYLHLPLPRRRLVRYFQASSLVSIHNLFPLLFFLPFWGQHVLDAPYPLAQALLWLAGVAFLLLASNYVNTLLRTLLAGGARQGMLAVGLLAVILVLDQASGAPAVNRSSTVLFHALLSGNTLLLMLLAGLSTLTFLASSWLLERRLLDYVQGPPDRGASWQVDFAPGQGQVVNLILLELTLIWRNKRPKTYLFLSLFFGTVYTALFMADGGASGSSLLCTFIGVFASGIFAMNYGQLMFAWESSYFDGFLVRNVNLRDMVLAKLLLLQGSCVVFFFITLPLFHWLAPSLARLHLAFLFYNVGVTCMLMMALAVTNQSRVDLHKGGGVFNYEGFSIIHWLWFLPTIVPPALLLFLLQEDRQTALFFIGGLGLLSLLFTNLWSMLFAHLLVQRRHAMAAGFRTHD